MLLLLKLVHILTVLALFAGLVGRTVTYQRARRTTDFASLAALLTASGWFDRYLVVPASLLVLLSGGALAGFARWPYRSSDGTPTWLLVALLLYLSLIPVIAVVLVPRGQKRERALKAAVDQGRLTEELSRVLADPAVIWARSYEALVMFGVLSLMVLKPF